MNNYSANRTSWHKVKPLSQIYKNISLERRFSLDEYKIISQGYIPNSLDDKWFIFIEENIMFIYNSRAGTCIYQIIFQKSDDHYEIINVLVNRDPKEYINTNEIYDLHQVDFIIDWFLLGKSVPFPDLWDPNTTQ